MTTKTYFTLAILAVVLSFYACEKDEEKDTQKPVVSKLEVGHNDTVHINDRIHLEFEVTDNEKLDYYQIKIHMDEEYGHEEEDHAAWEFDSVFTEISGLKNKNVHHDLPAPVMAESGIYHFQLSVADVSGNLTEEEKELVFSSEDGEEDDHE